MSQDPSSAPVESEADRHNRIIEEDLDAILERAEVVGNASEYEQQQQQQGGGCDVVGGSGAPPAGGAGDLLTSFNVATFKNEEDDATFWSRLIPVVGRPKEEHEVRVGRPKEEHEVVQVDSYSWSIQLLHDVLFLKYFILSDGRICLTDD